MLTALEIRALKTAFIVSVCLLTTTFIAGGIYWQHNGRKAEKKPASEAAALVANGRSFFLQSCAHCHGRDADGGEDAPSLLKLQISAAHMTLVIESGIKDEMPSFAKKYTAADVEKIVAYLQTLK
jgi:mono/diheme cytochrome c family protein